MLYKTHNLWKEGKNDFLRDSLKCMLYFFDRKAVHLPVATPAPCDGTSKHSLARLHMLPAADLQHQHTRFLISTGSQAAFSPELCRIWAKLTVCHYKISFVEGTVAMLIRDLSTWIPRCALCLQNGFWWLNENVCGMNFQLIFFPGTNALFLSSATFMFLRLS